jgi:signal transduction histidine kinase
MLNHELRTPLTQIHGYVGLAEMRGYELDLDTLREYLDGIGVGAHRMTGLVENLLLAMEIETGRAAATYDLRKYVVTVLSKLVARVVNSYEAQAGQAGVALALSVPDSLPPVEADTDFLARALGHLIDNAIKYSAVGDTVEVRARATGSTVTISVSDQGRGIPPGELSNIFDLFYQVDREYHEQQGAGLGLCITQGLVALHGGQIEVESDGVPGQGSTFALMLPVAP